MSPEDAEEKAMSAINSWLEMHPDQAEMSPSQKMGLRLCFAEALIQAIAAEREACAEIADKTKDPISVVASALIQTIAAEREACAALLVTQANKYAAEAKMETNGIHRQILMSKGQAFAEAAAAIRERDNG